MSIRFMLLLTSTLFACRSGSVKLDDQTSDTGVVSSPTAEPGSTDTAIDTAEDTAIDTADTSEPTNEPTNEPSSTVDDADGDGFLTADDCDDNDAEVNPDAQEICDNGIDNDCDGLVDADDPDAELSVWYQDVDGDGYGDSDYAGYEVCSPPPGFVLNNTDCDDLDATTSPGGAINEADPNQCMEDADGDGYGTPTPSNPAAAAGSDCDDSDASNVPTDSDGDGYSGCTGDCDDSNSNVHPGMSEVLWDGADNDCDGTIDQVSANVYDAAVTGAAEDYLTFDNAISVVDIDADGTPDVFVGGAFVGNATDSNNDNQIDNQGKVYMLDGSSYASWDGEASSYADASFEGEDAFNYFSNMSATQGDIDGDGNIDLAIGGTDATNNYNGYSDIGSAIFLDVSSYSGESNNTDAEIQFVDSQSNYGAHRIASHLDINGDGHSDVIISDYIVGYYGQSWGGGVTWRNGSNGNCQNGQCDSTVYLFSGAELSDGEYSLTNDATTIFDESTNYDFFGQTISGADLDGDGADELFLALPGNDDMATNAGCVLLYKGTDSIFTDGGYIWDMNDIDFYLDYDNGVICAENANARLGWNGGVVVADFNGDTNLDLAVAAPGNDQVFVFFDADSLLGGSADAESEADVIITADAGPGKFGYALAAGDMNGDGVADLAIGAPDVSAPIDAAFSFYHLTSNGAPNQSGKVYLFDGATLSAEMSEADANGVIYSEANDMFGMTIVAEDMNGDGKSDLWVGAPYHNSDEGRASLYIMP